MGALNLTADYSGLFTKNRQKTCSAALLALILLIMAPVFAESSFQITLNGPDNGNYTNAGTVNHTFTVTGADASYNCALYYNDTSKGSNASVLNNTLTAITATVLEGDYAWKINCTSGNNTNTSETRQIIIDTTAPVVDISSPSSNSHQTNGTLSVAVEITEANLRYALVNLTNSTNGQVEIWNITQNGSSSKDMAVGDGNYTITATAYDLAGNSKAITITGIVVNTTLPPVQPELTINSPSSNTYFNTNEISISITASDPDFNYTAVSLIAQNDSLANSTNITSSGNRTEKLSAYEDGAYSISATMYNNSGVSLSKSVSNIVIDTTAPSITITAPASNSTAGTSKLSISLAINEANLNYTRVSIINSNGTAVNSTQTSGTSLELSVYELGIYNITAVSYDKAGNNKTAEASNITVDKLYVPPVTPPSGGGGGSKGRKPISSGGGGTPDFWMATKIADENGFKQGYNITLQAKQRIKVMIKNQTHYIGIISLTDKSAVINVSSTPQQFILAAGSEQKVDIDNDSYYEVYMSLYAVNLTQAGLTIKEIYEKITLPEPPVVVKNETKNVSVEPKIVKPICAVGEKRCIDNEIQECINGTWKTNEICKSGCDIEKKACIMPAEEKKDQFSYIPSAIFVIALILGAYLLVKFAGPKITKSQFFAGELAYKQNLEGKLRQVEARINRLERHGNNVRKIRIVFDDIRQDINSGLHNIAEARIESLVREIEFLEIV